MDGLRVGISHEALDPPTEIRSDVIDLIFELTGGSIAGLGRGLGIKRQTAHRMVRGQDPPSPRFVRGAPLLLAAALSSVGADDVRRLLFTTTEKGDTHG